LCPGTEDLGLGLLPELNTIVSGSRGAAYLEVVDQFIDHKHSRRQQQPALSLAVPFGRVSYSRRRISPPTSAWIETRSGVHLLRRAVTSVKKPVPIDIAWEPTRPSYAPPRVAASRSPIAFGRPEPCRRSSGAFDRRRVPRSGRLSRPILYPSPLPQIKNPLQSFLRRRERPVYDNPTMKF
jgi:hypothetical protein